MQKIINKISDTIELIGLIVGLPYAMFSMTYLLILQINQGNVLIIGLTLFAFYGMFITLIKLYMIFYSYGIFEEYKKEK